MYTVLITLCCYSNTSFGSNQHHIKGIPGQNRGLKAPNYTHSDATRHRDDPGHQAPVVNACEGTVNPWVHGTILSKHLQSKLHNLIENQTSVIIIGT